MQLMQLSLQLFASNFHILLYDSRILEEEEEEEEAEEEEEDEEEEEALNPSVSNLPETKSPVRVQL